MKNFTNYLRMKRTGRNSLPKYFCLFILCASLNTVKAQEIFTFNSDETVSPIPDGLYNGNITTMMLKEVSISGIPDGMHYVTSLIGLDITHSYAGDLTLKLFDDNGFALGLMSRPGLDEMHDDGTECCGTNVDLTGSLIFNDDSVDSSEDIGYFGSPVPDMTVVRPSRGSIISMFETIFDFFGGMSSAAMNGSTWYFGAGDSADGDAGNFNSASIIFAFDDYCVPRLDNEYEFITNVTFEEINNSTFAHEHPYPTYYTGIPANDYATVKQGETYPLSVSISPDEEETVFAFIDWNQNKTFEADETYTVISETDLPGPFTIDIPVPEDAVLGQTRMRIALVYYGDPTSPDPCNLSDDYGEVEDYTVVVEEAMGTNENALTALSVYPNPVKDVLNINSQKNIEKIEVYNLSGQLILTEKDKNKINMETLPAGIYVVKIKSDNEVKSIKVMKK